MHIELIGITPLAERTIEEAGRTAHQSEGYIQPGSAGPFIKKLIEWGHESVLEHAQATFRIKGVSRALTHQLVRHRLVAYTQKSQRYVAEDGFKYVEPETIKESSNETRRVFHATMTMIRNAYERLIEHGIPKEDARFVLPNATETEIVVSANLRQWRHMIRLRTSKHAQWEIRAVFKEILNQLYNWCPNVFEDLKGEQSEESN